MSISNPDVTVLVPTRNEGDNINRLLSRLSAHFSETGRSYEVLFVDDSDDDTPDLVRAASAAGEPVRMIHRPAGRRDGGLAGALTLGMARAAGRAVIVMDGDLQHPPEVAEPMVAPLLDGPAQVTVGSRYAAGGSAESIGDDAVEADRGRDDVVPEVVLGVGVGAEQALEQDAGEDIDAH